MGHLEWCKNWWKENITDSKDGVISVKEFQQWFYALDKRRPKRFSLDQWPHHMIAVGMMYAPRSFEEAEEIKQKLA